MRLKVLCLPDAAEAGCSTTDTQYCDAPSVNGGAVTVAVKDVAGTSGCSLTMTPTAGDISTWEGSNTGCDAAHIAAIYR